MAVLMLSRRTSRREAPTLESLWPAAADCVIAGVRPSPREQASRLISRFVGQDFLLLSPVFFSPCPLEEHQLWENAPLGGSRRD